MSCDLCIDNSGGESYDEFETEHRTAPCQLKCEECGEPIAMGEEYQHASGSYDDETYEHINCLFCEAVRKAVYCGTPQYGMIWEDITEMVFPELTLSSDCFKEIPVEYRAKFISKWQKWKGLNG